MAIFLKKFPTELLSLIFSFLDATDIELRLKPTGDKYLLSLFASNDLQLALKLEPSFLANSFPFSRFASYRSLCSLSISIQSDLNSYYVGLVGILPPTLREIRFFCFGAEALFCRPLSDSDDALTHALYSSNGYTVILVRDCLPNLTLLHVHEPIDGAASVPAPKTENPFLTPSSTCSHSSKDLIWTHFMSWRLIEYLPPTITSLMLDRALNSCSGLLSQYLSSLFENEPNMDASVVIQSLNLKDDLIPDPWPSIAAHLPNLQHLMVHPSCPVNQPFPLGKGMYELHQRLRTLCWYHYRDPNYPAILGSNLKLRTLIALYTSQVTSTQSYDWLSKLQTLHIIIPSVRGKLVEVGAFPSSLTSLTLKVPTMQLQGPLKLPSQLTYFNSFDSPQNASIYRELPTNLHTIHINLSAMGDDIDLSVLPRKLVHLKLGCLKSNCLTPEELSKLPPGLSTLVLQVKNFGLSDAHIESLPRGLASLELSELQSSFLALLPPRLQHLACSPVCTLLDTDLIKLPQTLITLKLSTIQTSGSWLPRDLTRLNRNDVINSIRQHVPPAIRSPSGVWDILERLYSTGLRDLPPNLTSIDLRGTNISELQIFENSPLPNLTKLRVNAFGFFLQKVPKTLKYLEVSQGSESSFCQLISQLTAIETLKTPRAHWDANHALPTTLKRLHILSVYPSVEATVFRSLPQLQVLKFSNERWSSQGWHLMHRIDFGLFPASLIKLKLGSHSTGRVQAIVVASEVNPVPKLQVLEMPGLNWSWSNMACLPPSLTALHLGNVTVTSKEVMSKVSQSQWTNIQSEANSQIVKLEQGTSEMMESNDAETKNSTISSSAMTGSNLNLKKFQDLILQSVLPNAKFHQDTKLSIVWHLDDLSLIPSGFRSVLVGDSVTSDPQLWREGLQNTVVPATKLNSHLISSLPCNLTWLSVTDHFATLPSVSKCLPRQLTYLSLNVSHWNHESFKQLPLSIKSMEMTYDKEISSKFLSWLPKQLLRLGIRGDTEFSSSQQLGQSQNDTKSTAPIFSQLPQLLEILQLRSTFGFVAEDFRHLPSSITALDVSPSVVGFERYLRNKVKYWGSDPPRDYQNRLFEEVYSLPPR